MERPRSTTHTRVVSCKGLMLHGAYAGLRMLAFSYVCDNGCSIIRRFASYIGSQNHLYTLQANPYTVAPSTSLGYGTTLYASCVVSAWNEHTTQQHFARRSYLQPVASSVRQPAKPPAVPSGLSQLTVFTLPRSRLAITFTLTFFPPPPKPIDCGADALTILHVHVSKHAFAYQL